VDVDRVCELSRIAQDRHSVVVHLDEATEHRHAQLAALLLDDAHDAGHEHTQERRVPGEERDVATARGAGDDHRRVAAVEHLLGRDELDVQGHAWSCSCLAFASTDSTLPTLRDACSGMSPSSRVTGASNDSTVSLIGT